MIISVIDVISIFIVVSMESVISVFPVVKMESVFSFLNLDCKSMKGGKTILIGRDMLNKRKIIFSHLLLLLRPLLSTSIFSFQYFSSHPFLIYFSSPLLTSISLRLFLYPFTLLLYSFVYSKDSY